MLSNYASYLFLTASALFHHGDYCSNQQIEHKQTANNATVRQSDNILDFVPDGWEIESTVEGQLIPDPQEETVVVMIEKETQSDRPQLGNRKLLILSKRNTRYVCISSSTSLLRCKSCYGTFSGPDGGSPNLAISEQVLTISESGGGRVLFDILIKIKFDRISKRFMVSSKEEKLGDRFSLEYKHTQINYLSGRVATIQNYKTFIHYLKKRKIFIENYNWTN